MGMNVGVQEIIGGASSLIGLGLGLFQRAKARKMEKNAPLRPVAVTPEEVAQNQAIAGTLAKQGMGAQEYANATNNINRNVSAGLGALGTTRNTLAGVGNIVARANDATINLNAQDAQMQAVNAQALMEANMASAGYKDRNFQYNEADKHAETMQRISEMRNAGNQSIMGAVNNLSAMALTLQQNGNGRLKTRNAYKNMRNGFNPDLYHQRLMAKMPAVGSRHLTGGHGQ